MKHHLLTFITLCTILLSPSFVLSAQEEPYQWPKEPDVLAKLQAWQDLKFGIILHWGVYSVPGMVESWQITSEDWIPPRDTRRDSRAERGSLLPLEMNSCLPGCVWNATPRSLSPLERNIGFWTQA